MDNEWHSKVPGFSSQAGQNDENNDTPFMRDSCHDFETQKISVSQHFCQNAIKALKQKRKSEDWTSFSTAVFLNLIFLVGSVFRILLWRPNVCQLLRKRLLKFFHWKKSCLFFNSPIILQICPREKVWGLSFKSPSAWRKIVLRGKWGSQGPKAGSRTISEFFRGLAIKRTCQKCRKALFATDKISTAIVFP